MRDSVSHTTRRKFLLGGAATTASAFAASSAAAQEATETDETADGTTEDGTGAGGGSGGGTTTIDMTDELVFDPDSTTVTPGTTVVWENVGDIAHSVTAYEDEIPEEAEYFASGGLTSESEARDAYPQQGEVAGGESYEHTFEVPGEYGYFCIPHDSAGMVATLTVEEGGGAGEEGAGPPLVPDSAKTLAVVATVALVSILGFAYVFLKYGGDYGELESE